MKNYRFYSRRNGYIGGTVVRYYESPLIHDAKHTTDIFVDKSGKEIMELLEKININECDTLINLAEWCETYPTWFYYPDKTTITDMRIYL
jgi:hypothetical protein